MFNFQNLQNKNILEQNPLSKTLSESVCVNLFCHEVSKKICDFSCAKVEIIIPKFHQSVTHYHLYRLSGGRESELRLVGVENHFFNTKYVWQSARQPCLRGSVPLHTDLIQLYEKRPGSDKIIEASPSEHKK